jgi:hypothetical protein
MIPAQARLSALVFALSSLVFSFLIQALLLSHRFSIIFHLRSLFSFPASSVIRFPALHVQFNSLHPQSLPAISMQIVFAL